MRSARTFGVCIIFLSTWAMAQNAIPTIEQPLVPTAAQPGGATSSFAAGQFSRAVHPELLTSYGKLPLAFEANQGQTDSDVRFLAHRSGYALFLTARDAILTLRPGAKRAGSDPALLRMKLSGASANPSVTGSDELPGKTNYFIGKDPTKWRTNIPTYSKVHYSSVYPGVDLVYYGHEGGLEYDFVVSPGGDPSAIRMAFEGAVPAIDGHGDLVLRMGEGDEVRFEKPMVYQETDGHTGGNRRYLEGRFRVTADHQVSFQLGSYDKRRSLVIDPVLTYSTYLGGSNSDGATGLFVDPAGNAYITGGTTSDDFPTTSGAYQTTLGGNNGNCTEEPFFQCGDVFVTKLNPTGTALLWSTYLGGVGSEIGFAIFVDSTGVYVAGQTSSTNFPVTQGAFQTTLPTNSTRGGFVTKLDPTGSILLYSTYLSGSVKDKLHGLAVDSSGNAYVSGETKSPDFPTTSGAFQTTLTGSTNAVVSKLNANGSALLYSTFIGGNAADAASSIVIDSSGDAYITGAATSQDFPTQNPIQANFGGGGTSCGPAQHALVCGDAFVTVLNPTGSALLFSTYLGGSGEDSGLGIALDPAGNIYVSGGTDSANFPTTAGVLQPTFGGGSDGCTNAGIACGDAFLTEINAARTALVYSTYLGGSGDDIGGLGLVLDAAGNVHMAGVTGSTNFPTTANAVQSAFGGGSSPCSPGSFCGDGFVTKFSLNASTLAFSTYLGGSSDDGALNIAQDGAGNDYVVGVTSSFNFPVTAGVFQPFCNSCDGSSNAFVAKLAIPFPTASLSPPNVNFGAQAVGVPSSPIPVTLTNTGTDNLLITSIIDANGFSQTNNCPVAPTPLGPDQSCTINVTFTPSAPGTANDTLTITDNAAGSPQTVPLTGLGLSPAALLSPSPLTFSSQLAGASATLTVKLTNGGNAPLIITSIAFTGPNASEFGQTNNCPSSLAPDNSCTINVTFTPTAAGSATASLSVTDNAPGSPQTVPITGTSQSILTTTCTSLTVVPGQTAIFTVDLAAVNEFAPTVSLSCSGAPAQSTCTVSPSMVTAGSTPVPAQVTVTTMRAFLQPPFGTSNENRMAGVVGLAGIAGFAALVVVPGRRRVKPGRRMCGLIFLLCILATLAILPSCGGTAGSDPPSTATGTYPLTVTGTFQSGGTTITEKVSFNLVVQ
jgi:Abnormal spindle-like microcephaly-assoc'd, ASPM-SPD-2-Hydin/Beta-propeller repeat